MKALSLVVTCLLLVLFAVAQKPITNKASLKTKTHAATRQKNCATMIVDLDKGTINGIKATASMPQVKAKFPCFTGDTKEGDVFNCGGGVFYLAHDIFFYTYRDYVEMRSDFKGKFVKDGKPVNILGLTPAEFDELMGHEADEYLEEEDGDNYCGAWNTPYGCITADFVNGVLTTLTINGVTADKVKRCE